MYVVDVGDVAEGIERLPHGVALAFAELCAALAVSPWTVAPSINPESPDAPVRLRVLCTDDGSALVSYLVRERDRVVDVLRVQWLG